MSDTNYLDMLAAMGIGVEGPQAELPVAGEFGPGGLIGPVMAGMFWSFTTQENYSEHNKGRGADDPARIVPPNFFDVMGEWGWRLFWQEKEHAIKGAEQIGGKNEKGQAYQPSLLWHIEIPRDRVINWTSDESRMRWADVIKGDVEVKTLASNKWRYRYQMIALPAAVQAIALHLGMIKDRIWSAAELADRNTVFDDSFFEEHFGHPDARKANLDEFEQYLGQLIEDGAPTRSLAIEQARRNQAVMTPYQYSIFWERRARLWAALGEENAAAYLPTVRDASGKTAKDQPKEAAKSPLLSACLTFVTSRWRDPVWARVMMINDPKVDETFTTDAGERRRNVMIIDEIFSSEQAARAAAERGDPTDAPTVRAAPVKMTAPDVPAAWKAVNFTAETFGAQIKERESKAPAEVAADLGITVDQVRAWRDYLAQAG